MYYNNDIHCTLYPLRLIRLPLLEFFFHGGTLACLLGRSAAICLCLVGLRKITARPTGHMLIVCYCARPTAASRRKSVRSSPGRASEKLHRSSRLDASYLHVTTSSCFPLVALAGLCSG